MIAANLRKHPDAMLRQLELDLGGIVEAQPEQRAAFWSWLMATATVRKIAAVVPQWVQAARRAARALASTIKAACMQLMPF